MASIKGISTKTIRSFRYEAVVGTINTIIMDHKEIGQYIEDKNGIIIYMRINDKRYEREFFYRVSIYTGVKVSGSMQVEMSNFFDDVVRLDNIEEVYRRMQRSIQKNKASDIISLVYLYNCTSEEIGRNVLVPYTDETEIKDILKQYKPNRYETYTSLDEFDIV